MTIPPQSPARERIAKLPESSTFGRTRRSRISAISEDAEETRRVEENLRRWEITERQRRKAARGSSTSAATSPSLVSDVSRRASALWAGRKSRGSSLGGLGTHAPLQSQEDNIDTVPLTHINNSPSPSPTRSDSTNPAPVIPSLLQQTPCALRLRTRRKLIPDYILFDAFKYPPAYEITIYK
ncbi:hypothetical protein BJ912DRAFT_585938 [Pholiota molesta]|nr:hypothetical protein BJ912DRAFT_585938 [Pholiota molesta]